MKVHIIIYSIFSFLVTSMDASAQSDRHIFRTSSPVRFIPGSALLQTNPTTGMSFQNVGSPFMETPVGFKQREDETQAVGYNTDISKCDSEEGKPKGQLHGSVELSVMAGFGKNAPKGAGFSQNINLDYTTPVGKRGWLTAGGYMNHLNWSGMNLTSAGVYGELGYQLNDQWSAYVYGQKSLVNSGSYGYAYPYVGYGSGGLGYYSYPAYNPYADRLGAALRWTPNKNFMLQISVEKDWMPKRDNVYFRRYDYQR